MGIGIRLSDLEKAFKHLKSQYKVLKTNRPKDDLTKLTLFYAVECGLKATLAKSHYKLHRHKWLPKECTKEIGHKLNKGLKTLKINKIINTVKPQHFHPEEPHRSILHHELHEAWRYGRSLVKNEESDCIQAMEDILTILVAKMKEK